MTSSPPQLVFVQRVTQIPLVQSAGALYTRAKTYNRFFTYGLEVAEGVWTKATPIILNGPLQAPILAADKFAVKMLEQSLHTFPLMNKPTEEVIAESKRYMESAKILSIIPSLKLPHVEPTKTVNAIVSSGIEHGTRFMNTGLDTAERLIDEYLPSTSTVAEEHPTTTVARVKKVSSKAARGLFATRLIRLIVERPIAFLIVLDQHARSIGTQVTQQYKSVKGRTHDRLEEFSRWRSTGAGAMTLSTLRVLSSRSELILLHLLTVAKRYTQSTVVIKPLSIASDSVHTLSDKASKAEHLSELRDDILADARERFSDVEEVAFRLMDHLAGVLPSSVVSKLVRERHVEKRAATVVHGESSCESSDDSGAVDALEQQD